MKQPRVGATVLNICTGRDVKIRKVVKNPPGTLGGSWIEYFDHVSNCPRMLTFDEIAPLTGNDS